MELNIQSLCGRNDYAYAQKRWASLRRQYNRKTVKKSPRHDWKNVDWDVKHTIKTKPVMSNRVASRNNKRNGRLFNDEFGYNTFTRYDVSCELLQTCYNLCNKT